MWSEVYAHWAAPLQVWGYGRGSVVADTTSAIASDLKWNSLGLACPFVLLSTFLWNLIVSKCSSYSKRWTRFVSIIDQTDAIISWLWNVQYTLLHFKSDAMAEVVSLLTLLLPWHRTWNRVGSCSLTCVCSHAYAREFWGFRSNLVIRCGIGDSWES